MLKPSLSGLASMAAIIGRAMRTGPPRKITTPERLANLPLRNAPVHGPVRIRWNAQQIPSIQAGDEWDLSVALGMVHAHLRLAQMEIMRRLALGQVAEVAGPAAVPIDHALRLMRFDAAVPQMIATLPNATRRWLVGFIAGVNHQIAHAPALPYEFGLLDLRPEPWTLEHPDDLQPPGRDRYELDGVCTAAEGARLAARRRMGRTMARDADGRHAALAA